ncbi:hypothetical protein D3870_07300 [Noviherbaspirillum cavernae]|uniref:DUF6884 domain-containing protein n=2 Tax=Noviherbaspirillum cavernae TaxID=2320862 RepID=A0A418X021_9BURK|nr:hypothetical protein D3870_07300 [Noviherbaspirillum cavernae]
MEQCVALVSCVKTKQERAAAAQDLYRSTLFTGMRRYAEQYADAWFILSAEYGVLRPSQVIAPYERTLNTMRKPDRLAWASRVQQQLLQVLPTGVTVVFLAGDRYREHLVPFLKYHGFVTRVPMEGLPFGRQLSWLNEQTRNA